MKYSITYYTQPIRLDLGEKRFTGFYYIYLFSFYINKYMSLGVLGYRAAPELIPKLIVTEVYHLAFGNNAHIRFILFGIGFIEHMILF